MARIPMIEYGNASKEALEQFNDQVNRRGRITNTQKMLLNSLPAFHAMMGWHTLRDASEEFMSGQEINLFCHAISKQNACLICSLYFGQFISSLGINPDNYEPTGRERALIDYGRQCAENPHGISDDIFEALKEHFNDEQIVLITAFAGLMIATNLINTALKVIPDEYLGMF